MESNPITPRQRNRRADRQVEAAPVQQPIQQAAPVQQMYQQPVQQQIAPPVYPQQPIYQQTPRTMYQQPYQQVQQPVRPAATNYPPQPQYPQQMQSPAPQMRQAQQPVQPQYAQRPRVLNQGGMVNSGWQQPTLQERAETPHARATRGLSRDTAKAEKAAQREAQAQARQAAREKTEREAEKNEAKPARKKLPGWLTTAMTCSFLLVMALVAAYWLMQAYLVTEENRRIAAYEAMLNNYHITEQADGALTVTWQEHIEKYAAQYNLQPAFVMAIIRNESSFRTNAESSVGARGLMQLMPDTAQWIAGKLDDDHYTFDSMWDAETNIRYGCWYLGYLTRLFHGDAELVSGAYHAGQTTMTQWLSDREKSPDGVSLDLERLSDGPTKQYIGRVTQTYGIYQSLLYPDEAFGAVPAGSDAGISDQR